MFELLFIIESRVKPSAMQEFADWQSEDIAFEITEKLTKTTTIIASRPIIYLKKWKKSGAPGPRKESCVGYMLQEVSTS